MSCSCQCRCDLNDPAYYFGTEAEDIIEMQKEMDRIRWIP